MSLAPMMSSSRLRDLQAFDDTNAGVKGLIDAGVTTLPSFFHHPPQNLPKPVAHDLPGGSSSFTIPVIDLAGVTTADPSRRAEVVGEVLAAANKFGFFQVLNHGVPEASMSGMLAAVRRFNEEPVEVKRAYYTRDHGRSVRYHCNQDLFRASAAKWRDTVYLEMAPTEPSPEEIPAALRGVASEYTRQVRRLGSTLLELLSEALGVRSGYLEEEAGCLDWILVGAHYYPACPEPHLTMGATTHSDYSFLTVLLQDAVGSGTSSLLSRSTAGPGSARVTAAAAAAISKPAAAVAEAGSSPSPSAPAHPLPARGQTPRRAASPFASGLAGRLFGGHRATTRSSSSAAAVFERRFASAATKNAYDEILTSLAKPGGGANFGKYYSLPALADPRIDRLPYSIRILLESAIRNCDGFQVTGKDVEKILDWENNSTKQVEIPFKPARVLLQDFTGVPAVVDLACMRDAMSKLGSDPNKINPLVPVDLVVDHSVQVDVARSENAVQANMELEFSRNKERFGFLKWGSTAFNNMLVVPPGSGIVHQVNLEYLARVVFNNGGILYPDSVVGTDSHTTMIDGLGVAGWGVGGIEAEATMLGQPMSMVLPAVVGFKLSGKLRNGVTATDLVLTVTQMLRKHGVVGKFVEFYGGGMGELSLADRATIANMSPEYGATMGFFPVDAKTLDYLKLTGRSDETVAMIESYLRANNMFVDYSQVQAERVYSSYLELDLDEVEPCLSGPKRPHDRVTLKNMKSDWHSCLDSDVGFKGFAVPKESQGKVAEFSFKGTPAKIKHGDVVIAAITSCTNTSNPNVMLGAALVAKKACDLGLEVKPWIKTSLAPGSGVVKKYLDKSGLQKYLNQLGFNIVGYGCTTCIGNSGDLDESVAAAISENDVVAAAVLSGNRNFEGRVHALTRANYLASPPLVVAYALAGTVNIDFEKEPVGISKDGKEVYFRDIWPTTDEIAEVVKSSVLPDMFKGTYESITKGNPMWNELPVSASTLYPWDPKSTYIHEPPYFKDMTMTPPGARPVKDAYCLLNFGDSITTDHISPAGSIHPDSPAAKFLKDRSVERKDFNSYGSRRGNDEIMARGTFANIRLVNKFLKGEVGPKTIHVPSGEKLAVFDAAMKYKNEGHDTIILAGAEYGSGSSRDWAAKGPMLQGVKAVIAKSFERIHRSNLAGMGIVPLCFKAGEDADSLGLTGHERYTIQLPTNVNEIKPGQDVKVTTDDGKSFTCTLRFDTEVELAYYTHGGILPYVIRKIAAEQ